MKASREYDLFISIHYQKYFCNLLLYIYTQMSVMLTKINQQ